MPRRPRFQSAGYVFHVLNRAAGRRTIFQSEHDYDAFVALIDQAKQKTPMRVLAFCMMPNHFHLVLWPEFDGALSEYMRWLTVTHTQRFHAFNKSTGQGPLYQGRFKSFPVEEDDHFYSVCRYVERNALRANLVSKSNLWRWNSLWTFENPPGMVTLDEWPLSRPSHWRDIVDTPLSDNELTAIRKSVNRGCPYGDSDWTRRTASVLGLEHTVRNRGRARSSPE